MNRRDAEQLHAHLCSVFRNDVLKVCSRVSMHWSFVSVQLRTHSSALRNPWRAAVSSRERGTRRAREMGPRPRNAVTLAAFQSRAALKGSCAPVDSRLCATFLTPPHSPCFAFLALRVCYASAYDVRVKRAASLRENALR